MLNSEFAHMIWQRLSSGRLGQAEGVLLIQTAIPAEGTRILWVYKADENKISAIK